MICNSRDLGFNLFDTFINDNPLAHYANQNSAGLEDFYPD